MWNESRRQLAADLYGVEKTLGITYSRAVDFIAAYSPEFDSAYIDAALIGHCVRELINVLPHYIGEQPVPATAHGDDDRARDCLLAEIDNCNLANRLAAADSGDVLIPQSLAKACIEYRLIRKKGHQKSVTADSTTVFGLPRLDDPGLKPWRGARDFFLRLAHLDRKFESKLPSRDEMDKQLSRIDRSLTTRFGHFFSAKKQLMAMVEKANQRGADGRFERPESSAVLDVLSLVNSEPLRQLLYSNLNNPEWLQPLDEQGAFDAIMRTGEDGVELAWPESTFLVTASEEKAGEVVSIIMRIAPNAGFYGRWAVITIASKVPAEQVATIAPFITKWLKEPEATNSFWDVDALVSISAKLLDRESTYKQGRDLAYAVFTPHSKPSGYGSRCSAESIVRDYRYEEALDSILAHFPLKERCLFLERVLGEHLKIKCRGSSGPSGLLIPSVGAAVAVSDGDKGAVESLATALVAAFRECIASDIERFDKAILGKKPIPKRCALFALFEYLCSGKMLNKDLRHIVESLIDSEVPYDPEYDPETAPLVASLIAGDGKKLANAAFELVSDPRDSLLGRYRQMLDARDEADAEVEASRLVRLWQHERLALLRGQALPAKASALLQSLDEEFGEQEYSFELFTTTTITGPNSPISYEQMSSMSADDLLAHLEIWQPTNQDKWDLVAHAG